MSEWFCNIPGVTMTEHRLSDGRAHVYEEAEMVEIQPWKTEANGLMRFYREDAEVLRYLADRLECFDVARPAEDDDGNASPQAPEEKKPAEPVEIAKGGSQKEFALK